MRNAKLPLRILLDLIAATLLVASLAYYWLDNLSHELMGSSLFALVAAHVVLNRRWCGALLKGRYHAKRLISVAINLAFLAVMLILMISSAALSRSLLGFAGFNPGIAVRQIHMLAAYWAVACLGVHLGLQWPIVMKTARHVFHTTGSSRIRSTLLRAFTLIICLYGIRSSFEMTFGSKITLTYTLDMWDFHTQTFRFFMNFASIIGLYATLTHYGLACLQRWSGKATRQPPTPGGLPKDGVAGR